MIFSNIYIKKIILVELNYDIHNKELFTIIVVF